MSDNWVVQNLENALATWNEKLAEIWQLITQSPETFKGGTIWNVVLLIHDTMQASVLRCWCCCQSMPWPSPVRRSSPGGGRRCCGNVFVCCYGGCSGIWEHPSLLSPPEGPSGAGAIPPPWSWGWLAR